jgi:hypothetical protein
MAASFDENRAAGREIERQKEHPVAGNAIGRRT